MCLRVFVCVSHPGAPVLAITPPPKKKSFPCRGTPDAGDRGGLERGLPCDPTEVRLGRSLAMRETWDGR